MADEAGRPRTHRDTGRRNRRAVLRELVLRGPLPRNAIAEAAGLSPPTLSRIAHRLLAAGLAREVQGERDRARAGRGRPPLRLDIDPGGGQVLGISISPSFQTVVLADLKNRAIAESDLKFETLDDPETVIDRLVDESRRLIAAHVRDRRRLLGGFLMLPGWVDGEGNLRSSYHLGWNGIPVRARFADLLGIPMRIEGLASALVLAEARFGTARERNNVLLLVSGMGLGAGLIVNGRPVKGRRFQAGVLGAMAAADEDGRATTLERRASGFLVLRRLHGADALAGMSRAEMGRALMDAVRRDRGGEEAASAAMAEAGRALGRAAAPLARLVSPETAVLSGPLSAAPGYVAATGAAFREELGGIEVVTSDVTLATGAPSPACGLALCEYLFERDPDLAGLARTAHAHLE